MSASVSNALFAECFQGIQQIFNDLLTSIRNALTNIRNELNKLLINIQNLLATIRNFLHDILISVRDFLWKAICTCWDGISWWHKNVTIPLSYTGVNVAAYLLDKFLYGSPILRDALKNGLIASDIPDSYRMWLRQNVGWNISEKAHPFVNNTVGILFGGVVGAGVCGTIGGFIGSVIPGLGTISGAVFGAGIGTVLGAVGGGAIGSVGVLNLINHL